MTKKHFQALAYELSKVRPDVNTNEREVWSRCVFAVTEACAQSNPAFSVGRFIDACQAEKYTPAMHGR